MLENQWSWKWSSCSGQLNDHFTNSVSTLPLGGIVKSGASPSSSTPFPSKFFVVYNVVGSARTYQNHSKLRNQLHWESDQTGCLTSVATSIVYMSMYGRGRNYCSPRSCAASAPGAHIRISVVTDVRITLSRFRYIALSCHLHHQHRHTHSARSHHPETAPLPRPQSMTPRTP